MNEFKPDVLAVRVPGGANGKPTPPPDGTGLVAVAEAPPAVGRRAALGPVPRSVYIREVDSGRLAAIVEIVSASNNDRAANLAEFVRKCQVTVRGGVSVALIDLLPPTGVDPAGVPLAVWAGLGGEEFALPADKPLTVAAISTGRVELYADHLAVGDRLPDLPAFLDTGYYVNLPLEATYAQAVAGLAPRYRAALAA